MPVTPDQITVTPSLRAECESVLAAWDARDPWAPEANVLGMRLVNLVYFVCLPLVPPLDSPEAAAKFLRAVLKPQSPTK